MKFSKVEKKDNFVNKLTRLSDGKEFYLTTDSLIIRLTGLYGPQIQMLKYRDDYGPKRGWKYEKFDAGEIPYKYINVI